MCVEIIRPRSQSGSWSFGVVMAFFRAMAVVRRMARGWWAGPVFDAAAAVVVLGASLYAWRNAGERDVASVAVGVAALVACALLLRAVCGALVRPRESAVAAYDSASLSRTRLETVERAANLGFWELDVQTGKVVWSNQTYRIFDRSPTDGPGRYPASFDDVHPDDRLSAEETLRWAMKRGASFHSDHRIVRPDGTIRMIHLEGDLIRDQSGRVEAARGFVHDITNAWKARDENARNEKRLAAILALSNDAIIIANDLGIIRIFNTGAERIFGYDAESAIGQPIDMLLPEQLRAGHRAKIADFSAGADSSRPMARRSRISGRRKDGTEFPASASIAKTVFRGERVLTVILRDISEQVKAERTLVEAKERAESATQAKSKFLANMSHELRTPLNAIIGFSEIMRFEQFGPIENSRYAEYVRDIHDSGTHLLKVINDVLDVAKIEAGRIELEEAVVDLAQIARESLSFVRTRADKASLSIGLTIPPSMPRIRGDGQKLKQVLINLVTNAVKFTPEGGQVTIAVSLDADNSALVRVIDTGVGISADWISKLGQPFVQVENALNRRHEGTGLGLYLCKAIMELHGGALTLDSNPGGGTIVAAVLPPERVVHGGTVNAEMPMSDNPATA